MTDGRATLLWLRRDLRLGDHPALAWAIGRGGPVAPTFILDPTIDAAYGAAPRWRLSKSLANLDRALRRIGGRLILRRGPALDALRSLAAEIDAGAVVWSRLYDPQSVERDAAVKAALRADGIAAESAPGSLLFEPHRVKTKTGDFYKVYTPFWRACLAAEPPAAPLPAPARFPAPEVWPESLSLDDLGLERAMNRGGAIVERHAPVGEAAAIDRLEAFLAKGVDGYAARRDRLDLDGTSRLSAHLSTGELSPRVAWSRTRDAMARDASIETGATVFLKELVWREFAWHLLFHTPHIQTSNWRSQWDAFPWRGDSEDAERWRRGRTGVPVVDAAMRELYVTGVMHNRARMLVGSYLTKNLMTDWRVGEAWFRDCLVDWDPASNAMGWQWVAGSGPDAAPFFRIFNPDTQAQKFDPDGAYVARWLPEFTARQSLFDGAARAREPGLDFFEACPRSWGMRPDAPYPAPALSLADGRARALGAYEAISKAAKAADVDGASAETRPKTLNRTSSKGAVS